MKTETKQRVSTVIEIGKTVFRYGFIPFVLYLGFKRGADEGTPEIGLMKFKHWKSDFDAKVCETRVLTFADIAEHPGWPSLVA